MCSVSASKVSGRRARFRLVPHGISLRVWSEDVQRAGIASVIRASGAGIPEGLVCRFGSRVVPIAVGAAVKPPRQVVPVNQVGISLLASNGHQKGIAGRCRIEVWQQGNAAAAEVDVAIIQLTMVPDCVGAV